MDVQRWHVTCANEYGLIQPKARMALPMQDGEWVRYADHEQALTEKGQEIEAKETELGKLDAELIIRNEAYQQLMEKAVRFAEAYCNAHLSNWIDLVAEGRAEEMAAKDPVYVEARDFLKENRSHSPEVQAWKEQR